MDATHIYVVYDYIVDDSLGFYAKPDIAIAAAKNFVIDRCDGQTHLNDDAETAAIVVYRVPFNRIIEDEELYNDAIWESLDMDDE